MHRWWALQVGWCLDSPCGESITGSLVWHLSLCSQSQYQWGAILPVDVCVDVVHWLSLWGENQECVPACCIQGVPGGLCNTSGECSLC